MASVTHREREVREHGVEVRLLPVVREAEDAVLHHQLVVRELPQRHARALCLAGNLQ
jgi:hypothetical protein